MSLKYDFYYNFSLGLILLKVKKENNSKQTKHRILSIPKSCIFMNPIHFATKDLLYNDFNISKDFIVTTKF